MIHMYIKHIPLPEFQILDSYLRPTEVESLVLEPRNLHYKKKQPRREKMMMANGRWGGGVKEPRVRDDTGIWAGMWWGI